MAKRTIDSRLLVTYSAKYLKIRFNTSAFTALGIEGGGRCDIMRGEGKALSIRIHPDGKYLIGKRVFSAFPCSVSTSFKDKFGRVDRRFELIPDTAPGLYKLQEV